MVTQTECLFEAKENNSISEIPSAKTRDWNMKGRITLWDLCILCLSHKRWTCDVRKPSLRPASTLGSLTNSEADASPRFQTQALSSSNRIVSWKKHPSYFILSVFHPVPKGLPAIFVHLDTFDCGCRLLVHNHFGFVAKLKLPVMLHGLCDETYL